MLKNITFFIFKRKRLAKILFFPMIRADLDLFETFVTHSFLSPELLKSLRQFHRLAGSRLSLRGEKKWIADILQSQGYPSLSAGVFGATFLNGNRVVKLVQTKESRAYLNYARFCRRHHANYRVLPKIYQILTVARYSLVIMERLTLLEKTGQPLSKSLRRAIKGWDSISEASRVLGRKAQSLEFVLNKIEQIRTHDPRSQWDVHAGNILFRKEAGQYKMVLTDPVTY